ncbi:MAG: hypothetical protein L6R42_006060 [Xanthoria sp. 1 TBL-2021]|nr:MAG: hypothetical protein L6R42_006060 [Xanthoria sp. 1 TBL-2021]
MSDEWITVGKNNKPLRGSKGNQQPINGPKGNKKHLHQPGKLPKLPSGPPIQGSLLGIPPELRIKIWEYGLPSGGTINLSAPRPLARHRGWQCGTQRRYDPSVLSINRQIYNEASDVLYRRNFIVEVNCGLWTEHTSVRISHEVFEGERTRYTELPRKFPFHRAKHITIRIDAHVQCNTDHVFHHMVYVCGLLFVATKSIESLSVEIWAEDSHGRVLSYECPSWKSTGRNGFAEAFGIEKFRYWEQDEENASTKHVDDRIAFLLQPLELRKRVDKGDIVFCSLYQPSENLANTMDYYRALLRGEIHTNNR